VEKTWRRFLLRTTINAVTIKPVEHGAKHTMMKATMKKGPEAVFRKESSALLIKS
jgi:hypothetical protein